MSIMDAYEKYYERQPPTVKIIVVASVALAGYGIYRAIKKKQDEDEANKAAQQAQAELIQLSQQGIRPSYSASQYENMAQTIVVAVDGCGTDENAIFSVFEQLRNEADIRQLISTFGVRYTQPCSVTSPISYAAWLLNKQAFGGALATFLRYDLSESDIAHINSIMRGNGITYQF